jgi:hypothetical protein
MDIVVATEIDAPPDVVWAYVRQIDRHVEWMHDAVRIDFVGTEREGVGTVFDTLTKVGPLSTTDRMTITEWVEGETIGVRHEGAVVGEGRFLLEPVGDDRTSFEWAETLHLPWYFGGRLGEVVARPLLRAIWRRNLRGLRQRVEGGLSPGDRPG